MDTRLIDRFGLRLPLIQAPMAGVSTTVLAAAVTNAGGLGSLALGAESPEAARALIRDLKARTDGPFAVNVFTHEPPRRSAPSERRYLEALAPLFEASGAEAPESLSEIYRSFNDDDEMLEVILETRPAAVSVHFGPASPARMEALGAAGIPILATATSIPEGLALAESGVDFIVVQHRNAGGHSGVFLDGAPGQPAGGAIGNDGTDGSDRNERPSPELTALIADLRDRVGCPLIAAGGLMDGADLARMVAAGAAGVQMGTAFVGCPESRTTEVYRRRLAAGDPTCVTDRISGRPARGFESPLTRAVAAIDAEPADYPLTYDAVKQLVAAVGDPEFAVMWSGTGAARSRFLPAVDLVAALQEEYQAARAGSGS